jgi:23S rRNA pseudouridine1911/1915/1917 synthase
VNGGFVYREEIGPRAAGLSVLDYLANRYPHSTVPTWRERIARGEVVVDGRPIAPTDALPSSGELAWHRPPWEEPKVPLAFAILYRDDDLLAAAKPRGLPSVPNGGFLEHTLLHLVRRRFPEATPLHRLGRGTSGVLLFARTEAARRALAEQWRASAVTKVYRALVAGTPSRSPFVVDVPIGPVPHPRLGRVHAASPNGKASHTEVRVLATRGESALVEARITTGRPHQIRIHLAAAGHPLVGDPLYAVGGVPTEDPALPGEGGYLLHAHRLGFAHPRTGRRVEIDCGAPPALRL